MYPEFLEQPLSHQFSTLLLLGLAISCVSWTITHEEIVGEEPGLQASLSAKILLSVHLRVLHQSLRGRTVLVPHPVSDALWRMARVCHLGIRAGLDRQRVHERLQPLETRNQIRKSLDRRAGQSRRSGWYRHFCDPQARKRPAQTLKPSPAG